MAQSREKSPALVARPAVWAAGLLLAAVAAARCSDARATHPVASVSVFRVGIGGAPSQTPERGIQQFISNIASETLLRVDQEGRVQPALARSWRLSPDAMLLTVELRPNVTFHDGSPLDASTAATTLQDGLARALGTAYEDVESISASAKNEILVKFRRPTPFVAESLDVPIQKSGRTVISTAPFMAAPNGSSQSPSSEMVAYDGYYLGKPSIDRIVISFYPNVRAAWADMLRDRLDMLYEVSVDALGSMEGASNVSLYTFDRPYQYAVVLNAKLPKLRSSKVRRALNQAIDRAAIVRSALAGHGTPSVGPVSQHHWAFREPGPTFTYAPSAAAEALNLKHERMTLKVLTPAGPPYERIALMLKQQLREVGVDISIDEVAPNDVAKAMSRPDFEGLLIDVASGWSLFRPYRWWHSKGNQNLSGFSSASVDAALDRVRHSANDDDYRAGTAAFQQAIADDPPAIFLAWGDRSRAVTRRFDVQAERGRDVLSTLRLWKPAGSAAQAGQN
jgi:peptide/nickel transport system substrate-binding protein